MTCRTRDQLVESTVSFEHLTYFSVRCARWRLPPLQYELHLWGSKHLALAAYTKIPLQPALGSEHSLQRVFIVSEMSLSTNRYRYRCFLSANSSNQGWCEAGAEKRGRLRIRVYGAFVFDSFINLIGPVRSSVLQDYRIVLLVSDKKKKFCC